jgi:hypothetical protein
MSDDRAEALLAAMARFAANETTELDRRWISFALGVAYRAELERAELERARSRPTAPPAPGERP